MKKARPFITLFIVLILPLIIYGLLKLVSKQNYRPIEIISEKIANPDGSQDSVFKPIGDFSFQTQTGSTLTRDSLMGKIWVCNLFFANCDETCDRIHSQISKLQHDYLENPDVRFVSITVNPGQDKLEVIKGYAERIEATPSRWYVVTGDSAAIGKFITEELHYKAPAPEDLAAGTIRETSLRLVDWNGNLRGEYYDGLAEDQVVRMAQHMVLLEMEMKDAKAGTPRPQ